MPNINSAITSLLALVCVGLFVLGVAAAYQSWSALGAGLDQQALQILLLSGIVLWLSLYGLWRVVSNVGERRIVATRSIAESVDESEPSRSIFTLEGDSEFWFYFKMFFYFGLLAVATGYLTLQFLSK